MFKKGNPRPLKAGRREGTPNKATFEIQQACREHGSAMVKRLVELANGPDGQVALGAIKLILAYGYGRPRERVEEFSPEDELVEFTLDLGTLPTQHNRAETESNSGESQRSPYPGCGPHLDEETLVEHGK